MRSACLVIAWARSSMGAADDETYSQRALGIYEGLGNLLGQSMALNNIGMGAYWQERWDDAVDSWTRAAETSDRAGDAVGAAFADCNIAEVLSDQGRFEEAETMYHRALSAALAAGHAQVMGRVSAGLVWITGSAERPLAEAERWATHGMAAIEPLGPVPELEADLLHALAVARVNHGRLDEAHQGQHADALARTGFTHDAQQFAAVERDVHALHGGEGSFLGTELDLQVADFEEVAHGGVHERRFMRGSSASRRPSPIRLIASTVVRMATPGSVMTQLARSM